LPTPTLGPGEVLVSVKACGICATDVKTFLRGHPKISPGTVLGHEVVGEIIASAGAAGFEPGDRVVMAPYAPCQSCEACRKGYFSLCDNLFESSLDPGGFAETVRVPQRIVEQGLLHLPETLDLVTATLTEPLACCLHGLEALQVQRGESLLIVGDGPMGLLQAIAGRSLGVEPLILSGLTPARLEIARSLVDVVVDVSQADLAEAVAATVSGGVDKVMVSVGDVQAAQAAFSLVGKGGAINLFAGLPANTTLSLDASRIHYDEIRVLGTFGFGPAHFQQALALLTQNPGVFSRLITTTVPLAEVKEALTAAARYERIKTVVVVNSS
jgi:L-iditol 2-dehydrogenase